MKIQGKHIGEAWVLIFTAWIVNLVCFMAFYWVGNYCMIELDMQWTREPLIATLWTLGISKSMISVGLVAATVENFKQGEDNG